MIPAALALLVIAAFALRVPNLGRLGLIGDEGHQALAVKGILNEGAPVVPSGLVYARSFIYLNIQALSARIFGLNEFALRLPAVLFSLPTIVVAYLFGATLFDRRVGMLAAFMLALSAWEIEYARDSRMYTAFQFLYLLSLLLFYKGFIVGRRSDRLLTPLFFTLTFAFHQLGVTLLLAYAVPFLIRSYSVVRRWWLIVYGVVTYGCLRLYTRLIQVFVYAPHAKRVPAGAESAAPVPSGPVDLSSRIHEVFFTPPIALLKQLMSEHTTAFAAAALLFAAAMIFVLYKFVTSPTRRLRWALTAPIIACCFIYQFSLALICIGLYAVLFFRDRRSLREGELRLLTIVPAVYFVFYLFYALLYPPQISYFSIADTFFGYPNIRGFLLRWLFTGWPRFSWVLGLGAILLAREFFRDKKRGAPLFLVAMVLFPAFLCGVVYWSFYAARYVFHLYPLLVIAFAFTLFRAIDWATARWMPAATAGAPAGRPVLRGAVQGVVAVLLALFLSQDVYPGDALAASRRTYKTVKNPVKSITNADPYMYYHQDYKTPALYLKGHRREGDIVILMARAHVPPIYYFYMGDVDYVILDKMERHFQRPGPGGPVHYTTGSKLILTADDLRRVIDENREHPIWLATDSYLIENAEEPAIVEALDSYAMSPQYEGEDGRTEVFRLEPDGID